MFQNLTRFSPRTRQAHKRATVAAVRERWLQRAAAPKARPNTTRARRGRKRTQCGWQKRARACEPIDNAPQASLQLAVLAVGKERAEQRLLAGTRGCADERGLLARPKTHARDECGQERLAKSLVQYSRLSYKDHPAFSASRRFSLKLLRPTPPPSFPSKADASFRIEELDATITTRIERVKMNKKPTRKVFRLFTLYKRC